MYLENNFYVIIIFIAIYNHADVRSSNIDLTVTRKGLDLISPCSTGLVFYIDVNNTSDEDFGVELTPNKCCLRADGNCEVLEVIGACVEKIPKGTSKTLKAVAPLLNPFERTGDCIFYLDSKPLNGNTGGVRDEVKITFDTRLNNRDQPMLIPNNVKPCDKIDEDPFNNCKSVDCDTYYNGKKSYYDKNMSKCVEVPSCITKRSTQLPSVYDPINNKCVIEGLITKDDIDFIKELTKHGRTNKDVVIIHNQSLKEDKFVNNTSHVIHKKHNKSQKKCMKHLFTKYISGNKCTLSVLGIVILVQCCLICTMIYFLSRNCNCCNEKKVVRKFFNYRQDASVTTPLIGTSNIDTETTDFNYSSDFTNDNRKIKCYKACQKEIKNNIKKSMSDDTLSKCLTRRDWSSKLVRSEAIAEVINIEKINQANNDKLNSYEIESNGKLFVSPEMKENTNELNNIIPDDIKNVEYNNNIRKDRTESKTQSDISEQEIKCHSYKSMGVNSKFRFYPVKHNNSLGFFTAEQKKKKSASLTIEKSVQTAISADSLDDFLSERGMLFLTGENLSKYSCFCASDIAKKTTSSLSNKSSKNNVVKNLLSYFPKRSKHTPLSDPGADKNEPVDVELIHMSHASVESSINNELDYLKGVKINRKIQPSS